MNSLNISRARRKCEAGEQNNTEAHLWLLNGKWFLEYCSRLFGWIKYYCSLKKLTMHSFPSSR
jgi:hypothetical protein